MSFFLLTQFPQSFLLNQLPSSIFNTEKRSTAIYGNLLHSLFSFNLLFPAFSNSHPQTGTYIHPSIHIHTYIIWILYITCFSLKVYVFVFTSPEYFNGTIKVNVKVTNKKRNPDVFRHITYSKNLLLK